MSTYENEEELEQSNDGDNYSTEKYLFGSNNLEEDGAKTNTTRSEDHLYEIFSDTTIEYLCLQLRKLNEIWLKMGFTNQLKQEKIQEFTKELMNLINLFVDKEETIYKKYSEQISDLEGKIEQLYNEMHNYLPENQLCQIIKTPEPVSNKKDKIIQLDEICRALSEYKEQFFERIILSQNTLKSLIGKLALDPSEFDHLLSKPHLTSAERDELENKIASNESLLRDRMDKCNEMVPMICFLMQIIPYGINEPDFLTENLDFEDKDGNFLKKSFIFSESNVNSFKNHLNNLIEQFMIIWNSIRSKVKQLETMYKLLDSFQMRIELFDPIKQFDEIDSDNKEFLKNLMECWHESFPNYENLPQINAKLEQECQHYEQLKTERMEMIIENIRKEYFRLLSKCFINDFNEIPKSKRINFLLDQTLPYDSTLLELHETELKILEQYYQKYQELFNLIAKWKQMEEDIQICEQQAQEVYRIKNRGGIMQQILNQQRLNKKKLIQIKNQIRDWYDNKMASLNNLSDGLPFNLYELNIDFIESTLSKIFSDG